MYYHRELLMRSVEGRRIDLITVSGTNGMRDEEEAHIAGCFPEGGKRPRRFDNKPVFMMCVSCHA